MASELSAFGVIPARAHSSRFPFKVIAEIHQKPMLQYVWENASKAKTLTGILIATDSGKVANVVKAFGAKVVLTPEFNSGSDRVAFVAKDLSYDIIVNVQGDEPLLAPTAIDALVTSLRLNTQADIATLAVRCTSTSELANPSVVKVALSKSHEALFFSRKPIGVTTTGAFYKHVGIYAYRRDALLRFCKLSQSELEKTEQLEQLRALENGMRIQVVLTEHDTIAVDTPLDILKVENYLDKKGKHEK